MNTKTKQKDWYTDYALRSSFMNSSLLRQGFDQREADREIDTRLTILYSNH